MANDTRFDYIMFYGENKILVSLVLKKRSTLFKIGKVYLFMGNCNT